ncbi:HD domain-containing protein [Pseudobutyrivibrio sp. YE44]|uniref:HD-GYP domain-containing protein n=1 Tax=Pseudobutyrivibrio sp. YE44 TaxID=1520802 RepID=UPI0008834283|nr:HD domain-containing phosphohydrolase [Pseudobutyrivibrio sp. YE44]SDB06353.1 HD domain-containing protein [Pseudobutyrivibrio sp. YE44]
MNIVRGYGTRSKSKKMLVFFILIFVGTGINFTGADLVNQLSLPLYLDSIGTIIAAMFGGYVPGILVGLVSSFINGFLTDPKATSYGMLNTFIALFATWANERGWFKKIPTILLSIPCLAFIGGTIGALVTIGLYGVGGGEQTKEIVKYLIAEQHFNEFSAQIVGDTLVDLADKAISVGIAVGVYNLVPQSVRGQFRIHAWKQAPLTRDAVKTLINNKTRTHSLRVKIMVLLGLGAALVSIASVAISYLLFKESIVEFAVYSGDYISQEEIEFRSLNYLLNQVTLFVGVFVFIVAVVLYLARYHVILPLNTMAYAASKFTERDLHSLEEMANLFGQIQIDTGDETENLYKIITEMTQENSEFLNAIQKKNATISDMQNALIVVLADLVESRDNNTGDHIKSTAEYVELIMDEMLSEGIYKEQMTPKFISDVYQSAPLHDIGKISVSDVILNKPGKLTDEEFAIMKGHSVAGAEIIDRVIDTLPESEGGYLYEARNLALYHHEKWNGTGYPYGLKGEAIPLSARIMAVADVFDALVSRRSYKEPFTFEKAISIIEESAGSHFDPLVAKAFLNAKDRIRFVAEEKD